jgi:hypothetical protein
MCGYCKVLRRVGVFVLEQQRLRNVIAVITQAPKHSFQIDDLDVMTFRVTARGGALDRAVQIQTLLRPYTVIGYRNG